MQLKREIGLIGASLLVINGVIGAGIFALPAKMDNILGNASPIAFLVFGILLLSVVWSFSQLAAKFQNTGGPVVYTEKAFGSAVSFQTGWIYYLARAAALAANAHVLFKYAGFLLADATAYLNESFMVIVLCALLTFINLIGVKRAIRFLDGLTLLKLLPIVILIGFALSQIGSANLKMSPVAISDVGAAALLTLYAFIGFETVLVTSGETKEAKKNVPLALMSTVIATAILYALVQLSYVAFVNESNSDSTPLIALADTLLGPWGAWMIAMAAVFSIAANLLAAMISTSRLTFAMAESQALPKWFSHLHKKYSTPDHSIITLGVIACLLSLSGGFIWLAMVSVLSRLVVYFLCTLALLKLRSEQDWPLPSAIFKKLMWFALPYISIVVCIAAAFQSSYKAWLMLAAQVFIGFILYWLLSHRKLAN
ncbi:APC family permease [Glaciecola petra]|uniref:APC family permease n=1 Tax=Glaciecola petra TaxID=3075602 RepID=A0ABU2ZSK5_9ALTE|nr:APC family permease [Aestuariibacter sp. P117]MDT0595241.1 APC family permease [Aestuariibacter sp. P117]